MKVLIIRQLFNIIYFFLDIPAGKPVEFLVGFRNKGKQEFVLETLEASFRYPMDFNFYIQNFSAIGYNRVVPPEEEATLMYSFLPSESFAGRPFGLNINLNYRDNSGAQFQEAVYNETVNIVELEEGLDGETFFLYVFLAAGVVLLLVVGQQFLSSLGRKRTTRTTKTVVETGTNNPNNVDYEWLPKQTLQQISKFIGSMRRRLFIYVNNFLDKALEKSPKVQKQNAKHGNKQSPKQKQAQQTQSPRQRKVKRAAGSDD